MYENAFPCDIFPRFLAVDSFVLIPVLSPQHIPHSRSEQGQAIRIGNRLDIRRNGLQVLSGASRPLVSGD